MRLLYVKSPAAELVVDDSVVDTAAPPVAALLPGVDAGTVRPAGEAVADEVAALASVVGPFSPEAAAVEPAPEPPLTGVNGGSMAEEEEEKEAERSRYVPPMASRACCTKSASCALSPGFLAPYA